MIMRMLGTIIICFPLALTLNHLREKRANFGRSVYAYTEMPRQIMIVPPLLH